MRILVSGGSRGIGRAIVKRFAKEGHKVVFLWHRDGEAAKEVEAKTGAVGLQVELSGSGSVAAEAERAVRFAIEKLGGIDVLVNCAGISSFRMVQDITSEEWDRMLTANLTAAFSLSRSAVPCMVGQKWGRIIQIGSMWGKVGAACEVHYSAAKAGLRGLTMGLAKELGPSGITVNCVEPGLIDTDMNAALSAEDKQALVDETPVCRIGTPEDVAALVAFLAGKEAGFITGQCIGVDGGYVIGS